MRKVKRNYKQLKYFLVAPLLASCTVTPEPFTPEEIEFIAESDKELIFNSQESLINTGPLTLGKAFAMALKYNLENRVLLLEESLSNEAFDMARFDMMPGLAANAGYIDRNNINASFSNSIETGQVSLVPSSSQELQQTNADIQFTWNLLDFGVSYLAAKQSADNYLIAKKAREKVMLTLLQEVRSAYWYAIAMEAMEAEFEELYQESENTYNNLVISREEGLGNVIGVLTEIRTMIETMQVLDEIRESISTSRTRLATLINVYGLENIELVVPESFPKLYRISEEPGVMELMEQVALVNSADYLTEIYNVRIEHEETRKTMLRLLPGLEFSYGENYSSNKFYLNDQWGQMGLNLTGDIMRLFNTSTIKKFRETSEQLTIGRKLAVNMATVAGVNITWQNYQNSGIAYERASVLDEVDAELFLLTQNQAEVEMSVLGQGGFESLVRSGEQVPVIQSKLRAFRSKMAKFESYAAAQTSSGSYLTSLGVNPIPENYQDYSIDALGKYIEDGFFNELQPFMALNAFDDQKNVYQENQKIVGNVLDNDILKSASLLTSVEGSNGEEVALGVSFLTAQGANLLINTDGSYVYTLPIDSFEYDPNIEFTETFTYTVTGADEDQDTATLIIVRKPGFSPAEEVGFEAPSLDNYLNIDDSYFSSLLVDEEAEAEILDAADQVLSVGLAPNLEEYLSIDADYFLNLQTEPELEPELGIIEPLAQEQGFSAESSPNLEEYLNIDANYFPRLQTGEEVELEPEIIEAPVQEQVLSMESAPNLEEYSNIDAAYFSSLQADEELESESETIQEQVLSMESAPNIDEYLSNDQNSLNSGQTVEVEESGVVEVSSQAPSMLEFRESFISN